MKSKQILHKKDKPSPNCRKSMHYLLTNFIYKHEWPKYSAPYDTKNIPKRIIIIFNIWRLVWFLNICIDVIQNILEKWEINFHFANLFKTFNFFPKIWTFFQNFEHCVLRHTHTYYYNPLMYMLWTLYYTTESLFVMRIIPIHSGLNMEK